MGQKVVIDFSKYLDKKRDQERLKERIAASGWDIDGDVSSLDSDFCVYLIDSKESCVLLFGCSKDSLSNDSVVNWQDFIPAWDLIADPEMAFDDTHKNQTMQLAIRALLGLKQWQEFSRKAFATNGDQKAHILVIVDREKMDEPLELIVAHSTSPVMNSESIQAIVDGYING